MTSHDLIETAPERVWPGWLALLAGPLSFGITGPALVLPEVAADLGVPVAGAAALVTAFGWGIAVGTPLLGGLLARRGARATLAACAVLVVAGAALILAVRWLPALVVGSALQALAGAGFTVVAMSLAGSPPAMGLVTSSLAGIGAVAPLIGTHVSAATSWQVTLALPLLSLFALPAAMRGSTGSGAGSGTLGSGAGERPGERSGADPLGAVLVVGLVTALVFLPHRPLAAAVAGLLAVALLGWWLRRRPDGFAPVEVLSSRVFAGSALLAFGLALVNFGVVYAVPGLLGEQTGWSGALIGIGMLVPYLAGGLGSWPLVAASARLRLPVLVAALAGGCLAAVAAAVGSALTGSTPLLFAAMLLGSLSAATGQGALALRAGGAVPEAARPTAIGLFNLCYLLGAAFGPAIAAGATT
ncbi:hypothetical protein GCM10023321_71960 [Pseudonocardia eucalypti]|uniref:MFS transporter n=1 Tax=Pseudonocardia eucalypti TaxID=648755 RepID=A0ABP9R757_9PSEU|nr:MFS family permease [Pseudonocardia eucalypti]